MMREQVRFGVEVDRETDSAIRRMAASEQRSKRNMHAVLLRRLVEIWKTQPEKLRELQILR